MLVFPQLVSGALTQFPIRKQQRQRAEMRQHVAVRRIRLDDVPGAETLWTLRYVNLNDAEIDALAAFFALTEGSLNGFTFLDPAANLLAFSEDLTNANWTKDPLLTITGNVNDPLGGTGAFHLANSGAGPQGIAQTLNAPPTYQYAFSAYARSASPATLTLRAGSYSLSAALTATWQRYSVTGSAAFDAPAIEFELQTSAATSIDIFGPQAEAQWSSSLKSSTVGVTTSARFLDGNVVPQPMSIGIPPL